jgi:hypothetical protein
MHTSAPWFFTAQSGPGRSQSAHRSLPASERSLSVGAAECALLGLIGGAEWVTCCSVRSFVHRTVQQHRPIATTRNRACARGQMLIVNESLAGQLIDIR